MNELQVFNYREQPIRTVEREDGLWWVLKDVCAALNIVDHVTVSKRLDEDEVGQTQVIDSVGRNQNTYIINEPGLYNVILRSDKPEAKDFKRWVTHEVLPAIRKTGAYLPETPKTTAELFAISAQVNLEHERRLAALEAANEKTEQKVHTMANILAAPLAPAATWQEEVNETINALVAANGYNYQRYRQKLYEDLERTARVDLGNRQNRLRKRMAAEGKTKTQQREVSKLYIIAQDRKLRAIFDSILREEKAKSLC